MERDHFTYKGISHSVATIYQKEGILSFYSGLSLGIAVNKQTFFKDNAMLCSNNSKLFFVFCCVTNQKGVIVYHGCGFYIVTSMKHYLKEHYAERVNKWYMDFFVGALGATIS